MSRVLSKKKEALDFYTSELKREYPESRIEVLPESMGGFDVWVELRVPEHDVLEATYRVARLENETEDRFGVSILTTTGELEEAA